MIEMIPQEPYKRTKSDSFSKCPYCGKQFNMTYERYMETYKRPRFALSPTRCKKCGELFYFVNVTRRWVLETGIPATYRREFVKGVR